jgi:hypothetical protein
MLVSTGVDCLVAAPPAQVVKCLEPQAPCLGHERQLFRLEYHLCSLGASAVSLVRLVITRLANWRAQLATAAKWGPADHVASQCVLQYCIN